MIKAGDWIKDRYGKINGGKPFKAVKPDTGHLNFVDNQGHMLSVPVYQFEKIAMKKCIISYASKGRENYVKAMLNLIKSAKPLWDGDFLFYSPDSDADEYMGVKIHEGYPVPELLKYEPYNHTEKPYGFKPNLFQIAREQGYDQVIWCDSTIRLLKNPQHLLDHALKHGVTAWDQRRPVDIAEGREVYPLREYISDIAVERSGLTPEELAVCPQIMACVIIFDFTNPVGEKVFNTWLERSRDGVSFQNGYGSIRPEFKAHRHDQAALSAILFKEGVPLLPYGELCYPDQLKNFPNATFLNKGVS